MIFVTNFITLFLKLTIIKHINSIKLIGEENNYNSFYNYLINFYSNKMKINKQQ